MGFILLGAEELADLYSGPGFVDKTRSFYPIGGLSFLTCEMRVLKQNLFGDSSSFNTGPFLDAHGGVA